MLLTAFGYFLFVWSVLARGRYATSWDMSEDHKLVTWGPYRYVRHPSYAAYFILFAGLFLMLVNLIAVIPFIAIPGYVQITNIEEELLAKRFGDEYAHYQRITGKFFLKRSKNRETNR
jgi:protein-S-isoprenylcysteine O-methyltransferase Ste14